MADKEEKKEDVVKKIDADVKEEKKVKTTGKPKRREGRGPPKERSFDKEAWKPKTSLGKQVKDGTINDISVLLDKGTKILEAEIVDVLLPNMDTDLLLIGQSKGKFGGGQRRVFRQTQKKTNEGNKPHFATFAVAGNSDGYVGLGYGKAKETVPAREKALRNAKLNVIKIRRGCGSWQCGCGTPHSIPFNVRGKCGSVIIELMPAPRGTGLRVESECQKILKLAGIKDVWSNTRGKTSSKINVIHACEAALRQLLEMKISSNMADTCQMVEGMSIKEKPIIETPEEIVAESKNE